MMIDSLRQIGKIEKELRPKIGSSTLEKVKSRRGFLTQISVDEILQDKIRQEPAIYHSISALHEYQDDVDCVESMSINLPDFLVEINSELEDEIKEVLKKVNIIIS